MALTRFLIAGLSMGAVAGVGSTYNYIPNVYHAIFESMKKKMRWKQHVPGR